MELKITKYAKKITAFFTNSSSKKIFCVGLNKTGTKSLHEAFIILGIKSCHHNHYQNNIKKNCHRLIKQAMEENKKPLHYFDNYDAYSDMSLFNFFKELDHHYPGSKFILNIRDPEDWVISKLKHADRWNKKNPDKEQRKTDDKRREELLLKRERIHSEIISYFKNRKDFLVINVTEGDGWEKLIPFLGKKKQEIPFPHKGKAPQT